MLGVFFDHVLCWVIGIMGPYKLDQWMASLQKCLGTWHCLKGVSKLKQCTGCKHRNLKKVLVPFIAGAVLDGVLCSICALVEFIFQSQSLLLHDKQLHTISKALQNFHHYKVDMIIADGRRGKHGLISHFWILKLEGMGRVAENTQMNSAPYQYTSDMTEQCHQTHAKASYNASNGINWLEQCTRFMICQEKTLQFELLICL